MTRSIASHRELDALFRELHEKLPQLLPVDFVMLVLYNEERNSTTLRTLAANQPLNVNTSEEWPIEDSAAGHVITTQTAFHSPDLCAETRFPRGLDIMRTEGVRSFGAVPLTTAHRRVGVLEFGSKGTKVYSEADIAFMTQVGSLVAVAVDNALNAEASARYQQQLTRERDRLRLLLEISNAVSSSLEIHDLFSRIAPSVRRAFPCDYVSLLLYDETTRQLRLHELDFPEGHGLIRRDALVPLDDSPGGAVYRSRKPRVLGFDELRKFSAGPARHLVGEGIRSMCSLPLMTQRDILGTLHVASLSDDAFGADDVDLLGRVAQEVAVAVENALAFRRIGELNEKLKEEKLYLEEEIRTEFQFEEIIGQSAAFRGVLQQVQTVGPTDSTVLIQGETGTGKELVARALHNVSRRNGSSFVKLNCAAIPTGLLESELFGHEKGAFTGAITQKIGRFELARHGTFFLDEIGEIPLELQPKLLRVLQEHEFERLGGVKTIQCNVRLIAATNRDLKRMVAEGNFRSDLYYRLNVFPITVPPLRERREDIPLLVRYFAQMFSRRMSRRIETIPSETMDVLARYYWPGNIRELQNLVERAVILSDGTVLRVPLTELDQQAAPPAARGAGTLEEAEKEHILRALQEANWVVGGPNGAASRLGLKRTTLHSRMQKLGISRRT